MSVLSDGRRMAESRMTDTVQVGHFAWVTPPGSLDSEYQLVEEFYSGPARVKFPSASAYVKAPAGQQLVETRIVLSVPASTDPFPAGATVKVVGSADPALLGRLFRVDGPGQAGQTTAHRYPVTEES